MNAEQILEVINTLVGSIQPAGATHIDDKRTENLKIYLEIWEKMHIEIDDIAFRYQDSYEHSIKEMVKLCNDQLDKAGIKSE
jgi:hypothetical protein